MSDYIPRDAVLQKMWNALYALEDQQEAASGLDILRRADVQAGFEAGQQVVAEFPAADVQPVVPCKDCRHTIQQDEHELWCNGFCSPARLVTPEDYCSRGERREGNK